MRSRGVRELAVDAMVDAYRVSQARHREPTTSSETHSIIVVDGDVRVRTLLLRALEERGHEARATETLAVLPRAPSESPRWCVLVADVAALPRRFVPGEVARDGVTVVYVTGNPSEAARPGDGADRPALKPLFVDDWLRLIDARCRRHGAGRAVAGGGDG